VSTSPDPRRYLLTEEESDQIFREEIAPQLLAAGVEQRQPVVVFVSGQPGAGKTRTAMIKRVLDERGGSVVVNSDFYKPYHPEFTRLMAEDDRNAAAYTSLDGRRWMAKAESYLIEHRSDVLIETTMRDPGDFAEPARMFRDAGYRVETAILAVPESLSRLGILQRYEEQRRDKGHGRLTLQSNHDAAYAGVLAAADLIDREKLVDAVAVYRRGNDLLYANELTGEQQWAVTPGTRAAINAERTRPWTDRQAASFTSAIDALAHRLPADLRPELDTIVALATPNMSVPEIGTEPPHRDADVAPAARYTAAAYPASTRSAVIEAGDQSASPRAGTPTNLGHGPSTQREHGSR